MAAVTELLVDVVVVVVVLDDDDDDAGVVVLVVVEGVELLVVTDVMDADAALVLGAAAPFVLLLFVGTGLTIDEIGVVVLIGAAPGLNGVFCFCMLYMRLGHSVTRISRPNNSRPENSIGVD